MQNFLLDVAFVFARLLSWQIVLKTADEYCVSAVNDVVEETNRNVKSILILRDWQNVRQYKRINKHSTKIEMKSSSKAGEVI